MKLSYVFAEPSTDSHTQEFGKEFRPRFDSQGLIPCVAVDTHSKNVLMLAYMNSDAVCKTLETGEAWYWSRSRKELWHKGATSGQIQKVMSLKVDCDQDALVLEVHVQGDGSCCHTGQKSCFYRTVSKLSGDNKLTLE